MNTDENKKAKGSDDELRTKEEPPKIILPKEPKPSGFGQKPFLKRKELRDWLKEKELWKLTKMPKAQRMEFEKKLFDTKKFGYFIEQKEAERVYQEIKNFPTKAKEKYGFKNEKERIQILKILEKFFGK